ncbi:MAG: hypothetical protein A3J66_01185 [Candidatus Magasanikbacteria bacterium RIFCSPHIGHO2_02_FULL_47_14]|uniref:Cell division protein FtsL n=1 Tax=Candidatus Magasanikbacteria bacterium RIFCSPHIGHO2_02_FULL_47_14 TaxID=1798680 RepID=A0A1F6MAG1_9BACT|nr:MAG: hypothetical protein A3J66_01185 [Candidatus Magasanikbacteria bacterium RIFCSPHIGHO2_02_FULL_47_14]
MTYSSHAIQQKNMSAPVHMRPQVRFGLFGLALTLLVLYVIQTSTLSTKGFDIAQLDSRIRELEQENQRIDFQIAQHRSMQSIQGRLTSLGMVSAENPQYINLGGSVVARR